ncbi:hypothetical protein HDU98_000965, partial [Podochytrium sp. JEL0797]
FYAAVGHVPPILELGQLPPDPTTNAHMQHVSRHRVRHEAPSTPEGYWEIGFPSTLELEQRRSAKKG